MPRKCTGQSGDCLIGLSATSKPVVLADSIPIGEQLINGRGLAANRALKRRVSTVRIRLSPPASLVCFPTLWRSDEIGTWGANNAQPSKRRLPTAVQNVDSARFVSVAMKFGATTKRCRNDDRAARRCRKWSIAQVFANQQ
jgi:hypothetical protein